MKIAVFGQQIFILIRKLIFLPLILVFMSCTVTKRVHRPGYHVQWHKMERANKSDKIESKINESKQNSAQDEIILELAQLSEINSEVAEPIIVSESPKIHESTSFDAINRVKNTLAKQEDQSSYFKPKVESQIKSFSQNTKAPIFWRTPPENLRKLGIALMILGGILLFGSLLVHFGAFSGEGSGAWLNFFLDLIDLSDWFWLLFVIIGIILISYLSYLFVLHVLGGPTMGLIVGLSLFAVGLFFYNLGKRRTAEPPN